MDLQLFIKEGNGYKVLKVPPYVVKNLLRDRLSQSEIDRINRNAKLVESPKFFKAGSIVIDFGKKSAESYQSVIDLSSIEPTWVVKETSLTLEHY